MQNSKTKQEVIKNYNKLNQLRKSYRKKLRAKEFRSAELISMQLEELDPNWKPRKIVRH